MDEDGGDKETEVEIEKKKEDKVTHHYSFHIFVCWNESKRGSGQC